MQRRDLATLLADYRGDATVLRRAGHTRDADLLDRVAGEVAAAAEDFLLWLSETDAAIRSGRSREWLRARFSDWERDGHARMTGKERQYRACVIPRRSQITAARLAGTEAAKAAAGSQAA